MPILPAEPQLFPPDLLDRPMPPSASEPSSEEEDDPDTPRWWCLHTKPRQEKAIARDFQKHQLAHYLPQVVNESRTPAGRKIRSVVPLFPSYLFFWGDEHQRLQVFRGDRLVSVLKVKDQQELHEDLRQVHRMLSSGLPVVPEPQFPIGSWVRITSGKLAGMIGKVEKRGNRDHFIAIVRMLGKGVSVELEPWQVEAVPPESNDS
ncbi:transcription termination/antitermination protein NusG [Tautonia marina]|uniref:transcription termination/antitermination protein NusG n=1 Tax=Tautonia marina TaxID=2653855 RepID=UPI00126066B7|nr:transcription termination/antitermination NusG family protein [Tautonia marina]